MLHASPAVQILRCFHKLANVLSADSYDTIYRRLVSHCQPSEIVRRVSEVPSILDDPTVAKDFPDSLERMQFLDLGTHSPDETLTKVLWQDHIGGHRNWQHLLWNVPMLETWRDRWT